MTSNSVTFETNQTKSLGHRRRPSIGKSMPVTALFLNLPPPSEMKSYSTLSRDGLTPEEDKPLKYFKDKEGCGQNSDKSDSKVELEGESRNVNESEFSCSVENYSKPCLACLNDSNRTSTAINELCSKLCNSDCKKLPFEEESVEETDEVDFGKNNLQIPKMCSKIDEQRRKFLVDILFCGDESEIINNDKSLGIPNLPKNKEDFRQKFAIAEALAKTSMMTSPAAKRRIAARKIEMERDLYNNSPAGSDDEQFVPPRELLLYLVRMGSFNSAPKINNTDSQDDALEIPQGLTMVDLLRHCKIMRGEHRPQLLQRYFLKPMENGPVICNDISEGVRVLKLNSISKVCSKPVSSPKHIRIFQWNILSQTLGQHNDGFVQCPDEALTWENRKYLIVEEIVKNNPDIICLQEVDHFKFLERVLGSQNYTGIFYPKPDSPCLYVEENNGPDGCAIFYKRDKFDLVNVQTRILEVWRVQSNQVAIVANLRITETGKEFCVGTTHLKARNGALLSKLRNEQGKDLLKFLNEVADGRPILLCGDFNAEPVEPVYTTVLNYKNLELSSAYSDIVAREKTLENGMTNSKKQSENEDQIDSHQVPTSAEISASYEPPYTTWKIREEGEVCHTIDYVFYSKNKLKIKNCLSFPPGTEIGETRTPSFRYPSDHFSLVCDFELMDSN